MARNPSAPSSIELRRYDVADRDLRRILSGDAPERLTPVDATRPLAPGFRRRLEGLVRRPDFLASGAVSTMLAPGLRVSVIRLAGIDGESFYGVAVERVARRSEREAQARRHRMLRTKAV